MTIQQPYTIRVARTVAEMQELKEVWEGLEWHPNAAFSYFLGLLQARSAIERPHIIAVFENGLPRAMLVGRIEIASLQIKVGYKTLWAPKLRFLSVSYGGVMGDIEPPCSDILIDGLINVLERKEADIVYLNHLSVESPLCSSAINRPGILCRDHFPGHSKHWQTALPGGIDDVYRSLPRKRRYNLRRSARQFESELSDSLNVRLLMDTADVPEIVEHADKIASRTYQRSLGVGLVDDTETRQRMMLLARLGWLRAYLLYARGEPCAFWIGTLFGDSFHLDYTGYDPDYRNHEPGAYLFMKMIEDLCDTHVKTVDFGFGDAAYKHRFGNRNWEEASVYIFPSTPAGITVNIAKSLADGISQLGRGLLNKAGRLQNVKTKWRNRLRGLDADEK